MTLPADDRDILDRISAQLAADEPHLTGMFRVFSRLTVRDLIPDEDAVRMLPRPLASAGGGPDAAGPDAGGLRLRGRTVLTGRQARIMAVPALLLAILITVIAFTAGSAVMIMPSCMKSSKLLPTKPFGGRISSLVLTHGWPSTFTR